MAVSGLFHSSLGGGGVIDSVEKNMYSLAENRTPIPRLSSPYSPVCSLGHLGSSKRCRRVNVRNGTRKVAGIIY